MSSHATLLVGRRDVAALLSLDDTIAAVEAVFAAHGAGRTSPPAMLSAHAPDGAFHIKAGLLSGAVLGGRTDATRSYFVAKTNANFPENPARFALPAIQGVIVVCDAQNGRILALLDSIEITVQRTGAATAVAARHLAREDASVVTICGCGNQGRVSLRAVSRVRSLRHAWVYDRDFDRAARLAAEMAPEIGFVVEPVRDLAPFTARSDIIVTATPSTRPILHPSDVRPGTFVAAVGADNPNKQEIDPLLLGASKIVVDILEQCAELGDLHHALEQGIVRRDDVHAELGQVVAGLRPGRVSNEDIIIFDSTGMGLQDAAAAVLVYERAVQLGAGSSFDLAG